MRRVRDLRVWITIAAIAAIAPAPLALVGMVVRGWQFGLHTDDRVGVATTVLTGASWLLVAVAGIVALLAYRDASGRPDLGIEITFNFSFPNEPVFSAIESEEADQRRQVLPFKQVTATVTLTNASLYAAKNPGVRIELEGLHGIDEQTGWHSEWIHMIGIRSIQWEGGTESIVHGKWSRRLPGLDFSGLTEMAVGDAALVVTLVADGIAPIRTRMPVRILNGADYEAYTEERAVRLGIEQPDTAA
ncbi:hypothetical protein AB0D30_41455 [Streptomyces sp. NPDC048409]|uniref:hypothetical protein n=1 Tax=Streptomyces sp. NPDC048409 TaxID=3154723 RepID=UPI0034325179